MSDEKMKDNPKDIEDNKTVAAIGYVWILCFVPLLLKRDSKFAQYHGKQALVLFIIEVIVSFIAWVPVIGWILAIAVIILAVMGIMQALQGNYWEMPLVGKFAKKLNI
ncbi:DUF4870 domain-containing protein [Patescibacteria group bacterium]|nr:DUF4870 domain-containing protein [Patescibacteria group bacterium]